MNVVRLFLATVVFLIYGIKRICSIRIFINCYEVTIFANKSFLRHCRYIHSFAAACRFLVHVSKTTTMAEASLKRQTTSQPSLSDAVSAETVTEKPVQKSKRPAQKPAASSSASLE